MPPPPPPMGPPPPPGPPPPLTPYKAGKDDGRNQLLQSIRQGAKLKKTVTVDKSGPLLPGKPSVTSSPTINSRSGPTNNSSVGGGATPQPTMNGLGGLFAAGMPKLRPTGRSIAQNQGNTSPRPKSPYEGSAGGAKAAGDVHARQNSEPAKINNSQLHEAIRRQISADIRNRGPPPQPPQQQPPTPSPIEQKPAATPFQNAQPKQFGSVGNLQMSATETKSVTSMISNFSKSTLSFNHAPNASSLHNNAPSNVARAEVDGNAKPTISHGKPNLAPKPPGTVNAKPSPPPKKLFPNGRQPVGRAQSMRVPRSPPVAPPTNPPFPPTVNGKDFGTIRGIPSSLHQSQEALNFTKPNPPPPPKNATLPLNTKLAMLAQGGRPAAPPPMRPPLTKPPPPPPSRTGLNVSITPPVVPPPPPPNVAPPPPPPHRAQPAPPPPSHTTRLAPAIPPAAGPPAPPVRGSSMRNGGVPSPILDIESRFATLFHSQSEFPRPDLFRRLHKVYNSKNAASKQQAPLPPTTHVQLGTKFYAANESSTC